MKGIIKYLFGSLLTFVGTISYAQTQPAKISHAEPLYYDLVRDLGARKGEKEINAGTDFSNTLHYNEHAFLVEYEFAPINRLGLEIEADLSLYQPTQSTTEVPNNKLEGIRLSTQYSFWVAPTIRTTTAVGYTQIIEFTDFKHFGKENIWTGTVYNPFFVVAKRWGKAIHSLLYISAILEHDFKAQRLHTSWQINTSFHYVLQNTKHFVGLEINQVIDNGQLEVTLRPQVKAKLTPQLSMGFVTGIPITKTKESYSSFIRLIYEL